MTLANNIPITDAFPGILYILAIAALIGTSVGFKHYHWFTSIGYAFAIALIGIVLFFYSLFVVHGSFFDTMLCVLLGVYGFRFAIYLIRRHHKTEFKAVNERNKKKRFESLDILFFYWIYTSILYLCQCSPIMYSLTNAETDVRVSRMIGCALMIIGLIGEDVADDQKSSVKKIDENRFCDIGLHRMCRFPNYFFDMVFWSGVFVSGFDTVSSAQWILAIIGYVMFLFLTVNRVIRLEKIHKERYWSDPEYRNYANTTPILIPLLPIYHLERKPEAVEEQDEITDDDINID